MFLLFEEAGKFVAGRVLSEAEASVQVELDSGKRVKVKGANVLLKFDKPAPAQLLADAASKKQQSPLHIRGDRAVRYERVAQAMAAAQRAGMTQIGFITERE